MCRMLGIKDFSFRQHEEMLENFAGLAETGNVINKKKPGHRDGWGIGFYSDNRSFIYKSAACLSGEKQAFLETLKRADGSPVLIAHLRKSAWPNSISREHAHPFQCGNFLFAHNGTVWKFDRLRARLKSDDCPLGRALDSEVYFRFILSFSGGDIEDGFMGSIEELKEESPFSSLNCLLSDGRNLFAYREYTEHAQYYSLYQASSGDSGFISSEPLSPELKWEMLSPKKLYRI